MNRSSVSRVRRWALVGLLALAIFAGSAPAAPAGDGGEVYASAQLQSSDGDGSVKLKSKPGEDDRCSAKWSRANWSDSADDRVCELANWSD